MGGVRYRAGREGLADEGRTAAAERYVSARHHRMRLRPLGVRGSEFRVMV